MKLLMLVCFVFLLSDVQSYKILVCYPLPVKSLTILGQGIVRHLLEAGHEVTYMTTFPIKNPPKKNFRQIELTNNADIFSSDATFNIAYVLENKVQGNEVAYLQYLAKENSRLVMMNENVTKLLEDPKEYFDVVIVDLYESEVYSGLAVHYDCPMIWLYSMGAHWQVLRLIGEPTNFAYDPDYLLSNTVPFTFTEKLEEIWMRIKWHFCKTFVTSPQEREIYESIFGPLLAKRGRTLPDYEEVKYNTSLIFANEHNAVARRPSTPHNFKYIGGFHIEDPAKPLPKDLQDLMDGAKHGVIYFSMGTFWKSKDMPKPLVQSLLKMLGELKQTVIWKFEEVLPDLPKNVHILQWAPQPSILAHPNCRFFITHGGLLSSIEAIHFGVPIIGVPILFDQFTNVKKAVSHGYALHVDLNYDLPKNLKSAIDNMLREDSYRKKAKELSFIYHDRPVPVGAEVVHWVHHVIRTRGALHLRSPAFLLPAYERLHLDVIAFFGAATVVFAMVVRQLRGLVCPSKTKKDSKKKKN